MEASTKTALLNAAASAQTAIESLGTAYAADITALNTASAQASANELNILDPAYGRSPFVQAIQQAMGSAGLMPVLKGRPESAAKTPGNVSTIMTQRLSGF